MSCRERRRWKGARFLVDYGHHGGDEHDVAYLFLYMIELALVYRLDAFIGFLYKVAADARRSLLPVPGTSVGGAQADEDVVETPEGFARVV